MNYVKAFLLSIIVIFAPILSILLLVFIFVIFDTITGLWAAKKKNQTITSGKLFNVIPKIILYESSLLISYLFDVYLLNEFTLYLFDINLLFTKCIAITIISIEAFSMNENIERITNKNLINSLKYLYGIIKKIKKQHD